MNRCKATGLKRNIRKVHGDTVADEVFNKQRQPGQLWLPFKGSHLRAVAGYLQADKETPNV